MVQKDSAKQIMHRKKKKYKTIKDHQCGLERISTEELVSQVLIPWVGTAW
jgi:hypothetical protein